MNQPQPADVTPLDEVLPWPDRPRLSFSLHVTTSSGPHEDYYGQETGLQCPRCQKRPKQGDEIVRLGEQWWHLRCAAQHMRVGGATAAWLALAADLAARPSRYSVTETRAIVRQLLAITESTEAPPCPDCGLTRTYDEMTNPTTEETTR